jgi:hypothetical protein
VTWISVPDLDIRLPPDWNSFAPAFLHAPVRERHARQGTEGGRVFGKRVGDRVEDMRWQFRRLPGRAVLQKSARAIPHFT